MIAEEQRQRLFASLPVLNSIERACSRQVRRSLESTVLVGVQHLLETTGSLIESLIALGLRPENTFLLGKLYSANGSVEERLRALGVNVYENRIPARFGQFCNQFEDDVTELWKTVENSGRLDLASRVIVLDDGGYVIAQTPLNVNRKLPTYAVEQTMSGIRFTESTSASLPIIDVASSAAKTLLEPELIQEAVFERISSNLSTAASFGVVGLGNIGRAVASALSNSKRPVFVYDNDRGALTASRVENAVFCTSIKEVFENARTIFGCTGTDFLQDQPWWPSVKGHRCLLSCSSHDQEFRTVLRQARPAKVHDRKGLFGTVLVQSTGSSYDVLRGGFPINFDGSVESVPAKDIQLTRGLLMAGILQATRNVPTKTSSGRQPLSASSQQLVVKTWFRSNPSRRDSYDAKTLRVFSDEQLISELSSRQLTSASHSEPEQPAGVVSSPRSLFSRLQRAT